MNIGLMGGTFDPPHLGHVLPVADVASRFSLRETLFVPNSIPPHKVREHLTDPFHRAAMVAIAIQNYPNFLLSTRELLKGRAVYTVETVEELRREMSSADRLFLVIGADSFLEFQSWFRYERLLELCEFVIMNRGTNEEDLKENLKRLESATQRNLAAIIHFVSTPWIPVSSTAIRQALKEGQSTSGMLAPEVEAYIRKHSLYLKEEPSN